MWFKHCMFATYMKKDYAQYDLCESGLYSREIINMFMASHVVVVIAWWVLGKVQPDRAHPSPGRTCGRWVHHGTLLPIWPLSSYYEDICPVMSCWHQLFYPQLGDSWRAGASSFPYRSKGPAHCPDDDDGDDDLWWWWWFIVFSL